MRLHVQNNRGYMAGILALVCMSLLALQSDRVDHAVDGELLTPAACPQGRRHVLYGVFTTAGKSETRQAFRRGACRAQQYKLYATVFVLGRAGSYGERAALRKEHEKHGDIFELSTEENMNEGKSYHFFKEALNRLPCFMYYAKVDDDTVFHPVRLAQRVLAEDGHDRTIPLLIGRQATNNDRSQHMLLVKTLLFSLRDMSWVLHFENYTAGMLYVLNMPAVRAWVALNPTALYGDEDYRMTYYMGLVGARVVDMGEAFHDHAEYRAPFPWQGNWCQNITRNSLAVHKCKTPETLGHAWAEICSLK